jgi:hypothetical protein
MLLACALFLGSPALLCPAEPSSLAHGTETLHYGIQWRVFNAGTAKLTMVPSDKGGKQEWQSNLRLDSSGVIAAFYRVADDYSVHLEDDFCASTSVFSALEGKRSRETRVSYDRAKGRATFVEKDRLKNSILKAGQTDVPQCVSDVVGGVYRLRTMKLEPGNSVRIPISDGKKMAQVRVDVQGREQIETKLGKFKTVRCEPLVFNGVIFAKKATVQMWLTDDEKHLPVQIQVRLPLVIGTITFQLEKEEHT